MQEVVETAIRLVGVSLLKLVTFGRYRSDRASLVAEGALGLLVIAAVTWSSYRWLR